jgi:hypothetical protein
MEERDDRLPLDRATELGRILFTQDEDLLREAASRQQRGEAFAGVIYVHQEAASIRQCVEDLELIAGLAAPKSSLESRSWLPHDRIRVTVENGWITLEGECGRPPSSSTAATTRQCPHRRPRSSTKR